MRGPISLPHAGYIVTEDIPTASVSVIKALLAEASGRRLKRLLAEFDADMRPGVRHAVEAGKRRAAAEALESARLRALYRLEGELAAAGHVLAAGVDEVGRGALAGPVTAAACILPAKPRIAGLNDSKRLTPARREEVAHEVRTVAVSWSIAHIGPEIIDEFGMTIALRRAMTAALDGLARTPDRVLVDGLRIGIAEDEIAIVGGDARVAAIAAASCIAKVARDALMVSHSTEHSVYGFEINKGYGTAEHLEAIARHGRCELHRVTFCPGRGTGSLF